MCILRTTIIDLGHWENSNACHLYLEDAWFESQLGPQLKFCHGFPQSFMANASNQMTASVHIFPNSSFINHISPLQIYCLKFGTNQGNLWLVKHFYFVTLWAIYAFHLVTDLCYTCCLKWPPALHRYNIARFITEFVHFHMPSGFCVTSIHGLHNSLSLVCFSLDKPIPTHIPWDIAKSEIKGIMRPILWSFMTILTCTLFLYLTIQVRQSNVLL
jgi:hypothetical protein